MTQDQKDEIKRLLDKSKDLIIYLSAHTEEELVNTIYKLVKSITTLTSELERVERRISEIEIIAGYKHYESSSKCVEDTIKEYVEQLTLLKSDIKRKDEALSPLSAWWAFTQAQYQLENDGKSIPEDLVVLSFMGSGASTNVTAGQLNKAFSTNQSTPTGE